MEIAAQIFGTLQPFAVAALVAYLVLPRLWSVVKPLIPAKASVALPVATDVATKPNEAEAIANAIQVILAASSKAQVVDAAVAVLADKVNSRKPEVVAFCVLNLDPMVCADTHKAVVAETAANIWGKAQEQQS